MTVAILLVACAGRTTYVPLDQSLPVQTASDEEVRQSFAFAMERGRVPGLTWSAVPGAPAKVVTSSDLDRLPPAVLWSAWVCSSRRMRGSELDLIVDGSVGKVPLTVQIDLDGAIRLQQGSEPPSDTPSRTDRDAWMHELTIRHGLGGIVDGDRAWTLEELVAVDQALALVSPLEMLLLEGLVLSRDHTSPRSPRELALYDPMAHPVVIHVYDGAFDAARWSFVGPPDDPTSAPVMTLVHEFGHVLSDAPIVAAWRRKMVAEREHEAARGEDVDRTAAMVRLAHRDIRGFGSRGPVIRDYAELRRAGAWPTTWSTDVFESFAEAYALFRVDPEALQRVAPEAYRWFDNNGHLAWRTFPD